jgi:formylglycine-generating enzyme required for sulfatase activity
VGQRLALVIGNCVFEDNTLTQLEAPDADVDSLVEVLRDKDIGGFDEVIPLVNENYPKVNKEIARFYNRKKRDDLLLLYYSGHGVRDKRGRLYLTVRDTERDLLSATAIPAAYITDVMDGCLSKRKVLILDCCHSGAFGAKGIIGTSVGTGSEFAGSGSGKVVLTATDSTQYAWEGDRVTGEADKSVFTHFLTQGLKTGAADSDDDGMITIDELYDYVYEQVIDVTPDQTPEKWSFRQRGEIVIAYAKRLSPELQRRLDDPDPYIRMGALLELRSLLIGDDAQLSGLAADALERMTEDDSRRVSAEAIKILDEFEREEEISTGMIAEPQIEPLPRDWKKILTTPWVIAAIIGVILIGVSIFGIPFVRGLIQPSAPTGEAAPPALTETALAAAVLPASSSTPTHTTQPSSASPQQSSSSTPSDTTISPKAITLSSVDRMVLVYVPEGEFLMGTEDSDTYAHDNEKPQQRVNLDAFWIDQTEVTNAMFKRFVAATGYQTDAEEQGFSWIFNLTDATFEEVDGADWQHPRGPDSNIEGLDDHPVVQVSWNDSLAYCKWVERRLPTETEWEKAARGEHGQTFSWGDQEIAGNRLNFADRMLDVTWADMNIVDGYEFTAPTGNYPAGASPYGAFDMSGNVYEWVADWYDSDYYTSAPDSNPQGPTTGEYRVKRGGSWHSSWFYLRAAYRSKNNPDFRDDSYGFRCARSATTPTNTPLASATPTPVPDSGEIDIPMVLIPAGSFEMGSQDGDTNESPVHVVSLEDFYIDTYEVTNELFALFLNQMGNQEQAGSTWLEVDRPEVRIHQVSGTWQADTGYADHPVVKVTWNGARAFCEWRGVSLPTEAQWEKAARGGLEGMLYPWGDEPPLCQPGAPNGAKFDDDAGCNDTDTEPVGSYSPNGYDLFDMAGNAWEWVWDWYADNFYTESPNENPTGPESGYVHVIRGGSAYDAFQHLRVAGRVRDNPDDRLALIGFRCVRSP